MRLLHLDIENFGRLQGYSLDLREGLNVLHEKNGWGKSTLAVFIKAMLYGLPASTKRSLDRNERKKYAPWQGGAYGGSLEFECEKGRFRVERIFAAREADDEFRLFDLSTNRPSSAFSPALGTELLGIDAEGFERSAYLSQQGMDLQEGNASVTAKLTGLLEEVNDMGSFEEAVRALDRLRDGDRVLIAEGCTHHRQCGDIGTVKLPAWIRRHTGKEISFSFTSGTEFPDDLSQYALVVHCGGCMLNEREMKYRLACAKDQQVPMTNYGILIAHVNGILKRSVEPFPKIWGLLQG